MKYTFTLMRLVALILCFIELPAAAKEIFLGPPNPGAEEQRDDWNHGASGNGYLSYDDTDPATGGHDFTLGNTNPDRGSHADWRSEIFPLGPAAAGLNPITFSFSYKFTDKVNEQDNIRVQLRFYDKAKSFLAQKEFFLGSASQDSEMSAYKKMSVTGIRAPKKAQGADVSFNANFFKDDHWSSGTARFDDFAVTTVLPFPFFKVVAGLAALLLIAGLTAWFIRHRSQRK